MENIRAKIKRRFSHKEPNPNFDDHDSADEETTSYLSKEIESAEKDGHETGKPGSLLNRMISYGNKKTEDQIAQEHAAAADAGAGTGASSTTSSSAPGTASSS